MVWKGIGGGGVGLGIGSVRRGIRGMMIIALESTDDVRHILERWKESDCPGQEARIGGGIASAMNTGVKTAAGLRSIFNGDVMITVDGDR